MSKTKTTDKQPATAQMKLKDGFTIGGKTINFSLEDKVCSILMLLLVFLVYMIRSNFLLIPFERDEGIYSYFGNLMLEGKIPYKDFYESKFPGLFYLYEFMVRFFGDTVEGMHRGFMWMNIFTMLFIYFASRSMFSPIAGIISAITYAFVSMTANLSGFTVQSEQGVAFFTAMGLFFYALARMHHKLYNYVLMGIAMAMAFMVKTSGVFLVLWGGFVLILDWLFTKRPRSVKELLISVGGYSAGGVLILAVFFTIIYLKGSFSDMIWWTYTHSKNYVNAMPLEEGMTYFRYTRDAILMNHKFFWMHALLAITLCLFKAISWREKLMGISLLGFSFLTIVPGFYFYGHYWIQVVPGLSLVAGLTFFGFENILRTKLPMKVRNIKYVYLTVFIMITFSHMSKLKSYYFHPNYELILRQVYGNNPFPEAMEIGNYINSHSKPEDNITLIGSEPQIYFYTHKRSPSRHAYFTSIVNAIPQHKAWQREFVSDVERQKPKFIVFFNHPFSLLVQKDVDNFVFQWANKYITENYTSVGVVDMIEGQHATYVWDPAVISTYRPVSTNVIYIFERKAGVNPLPTDTTKAITVTPVTP